MKMQLLYSGNGYVALNVLRSATEFENFSNCIHNSYMRMYNQDCECSIKQNLMKR